MITEGEIILVKARVIYCGNGALKVEIDSSVREIGVTKFLIAEIDVPRLIVPLKQNVKKQKT